MVQVAFKIRIGGTTNLARINYFASFLAMWMVVLMWPLVMYLRFTDIEHWEIVDIPWVVLGRYGPLTSDRTLAGKNP